MLTLTNKWSKKPYSPHNETSKDAYET